MDEPYREVPLDEVSELILAGPVSLTTPAVHELLRRETPVASMLSGFWFLGSTGASGPRSAAARSAQYAFAADDRRTLAAARDLIAAKIRIQRTILRRNWHGKNDDRAVLMWKPPGSPRGRTKQVTRQRSSDTRARRLRFASNRCRASLLPLLGRCRRSPS